MHCLAGAQVGDHRHAQQVARHLELGGVALRARGCVVDRRALESQRQVDPETLRPRTGDETLQVGIGEGARRPQLPESRNGWLHTWVRTVGSDTLS